MDEYIELNLSNYDHDDVCQLNSWAIWAFCHIEELERATKPITNVRDVRLCTDQDGNEAIYVDGDRVAESETIYMCEVTEACGGHAVILRHHSVKVDRSSGWPSHFSRLIGCEGDR